MSTGTLTQILRPIKLAFFVDPSNKKDVLKSITLNTYLRGGTFITFDQIASGDNKASVSARTAVTGMNEIYRKPIFFAFCTWLLLIWAGLFAFYFVADSKYFPGLEEKFSRLWK